MLEHALLERSYVIQQHDILNSQEGEAVMSSKKVLQSTKRTANFEKRIVGFEEEKNVKPVGMEKVQISRQNSETHTVQIPVYIFNMNIYGVLTIYYLWGNISSFQ